MEISELSGEVSEGVQSASQVVKQVDQGLDTAKQQAKKIQSTTGSVFTGFRVAWKTFTRKNNSDSQRRNGNRLPGSGKSSYQLRERDMKRLEIYSSDYEDEREINPSDFNSNHSLYISPYQQSKKTELDPF